MSRAGLISLILSFAFLGLVASAPVRERLSSLAERYYDDHEADFVTRTVAILRDREYNIADHEYTKRDYPSMFDEREFDIADDEYMNREYDSSIFYDREFGELEYEYSKRDDSDVHILYRRKSIFTKIRDGFRKVGHAIKKGFQKAGGAIKKGFQKAGKALKTGFKKVGTFIKKTAAKVAKVYLKVAAAVASVASKVVKFIPGVGTALSTAIKGVAVGANIASDKIHANLGKLGKFTNGLNYVINPVGSAAKAVGKKTGKAGAVMSSLFF